WARSARRRRRTAWRWRRQRAAGALIRSFTLPLGDRFRAQTTIELDRRLVPWQHSPVHAIASTRNASPRDVREQLSSKATAAPRGVDEQILQVDSRPTSEGRKRREEDREANRLVA